MLWDNQYATHIEEIDAQHRQWLSLVEQLFDAALTGHVNQELSEIFAGAFAYTQTHFRFEEAMMARYGYPDLNAHKLLHRQMIERLELLREKIDQTICSEGEINSDELVTLCRAFNDWLIEHIEKEDKKFVPHILKVRQTS